MDVLKHIVIVGAGAAGVSVASHLAARDCGSIKSIVLVDVNRPGHGMAFGHHDAHLLCNTSASANSLLAHDPDDFIQWLERRGLGGDRDAHVPRGLLARYLYEHYRDARQVLAARGVDVRHVRERVGTIVGSPGDYRIGTTGSTLRATDVVVCVGADTPVLPELVAPHADAESVTVGPYPIERLIAATNPGAHVLVIGTRQSAVDAALVLAREGRDVTLTSRSGFLPAVRAKCAPSTRTLATRARIAALDAADPHLAAKLIRIGVEHLRGYGRLPIRAQRSVAPDAMTRLAEETRLAASGFAHWQELPIDLAAGLNESPWVLDLPVQARVGLERHFKTFLTRYLTAIPLINAQRLLHYHRIGAFRLLRAFPNRLVRTRRGWRAEGVPEPRHFDHVVTAAGHTAPVLAAIGAPHAPIELRFLPGTTGPANYRVDTSLRLGRPGSPVTERIWAVGFAAAEQVYVPGFLLTAVGMAARVAIGLAPEPSSASDRS